MPAAPLPQSVDLRKAVARKDCYEGVLGASQLPQWADVLDPHDPTIAISVAFSRDEQGQAVADVEVRASVVLQCQRCLGALQDKLHGKSRLGLVLTDEQARQLPAGYEPWIAIDEIDLWQVAAEEIALALPVVAYHPAGECEAPAGASEPIEDTESRETADNPFGILSKLLDSDDSKET